MNTTWREQIAWGAGFLEGEGSFTVNGAGTPQLSACQVQKEPLERLAAMFGGAVKFRDYAGRYSPNNQSYYVWGRMSANGYGVMMMLYPFMSPLRKAQIRRVVEKWRSRPGKHSTWKKCHAGHEFTEQNTLIYVDPKGGKHRYCRTCRRATRKSFVARKKMASA